MKCVKAAKLMSFAMAALAVLRVGPSPAAEVRGTVSMDYQGLFEPGSATRAHPVSVALLPDEGQHTVPRGVRHQRIEVVGNRMRPAFLTVQQGDYIEFVNRDNVYHELFSLSPGEPVKARLGKANQPSEASAEFRLDQPGTIHFFCRIHNKSYARIDVVATPYIQMVEPGGIFDFVGLSPGRWKLRLASPAAETAWVDVAAVTMPPSLKLTLTSHGGGQGRGRSLGAAGDVGRLYRQVAAGETGK